MTANVLRDAEIVSALRPIIERGLTRYLDDVRRALTEPIRVRGRRRERVEAAVRAAVDFHVWRALSPLGDARGRRAGSRAHRAGDEGLTSRTRASEGIRWHRVGS